jgi:hypothetical protein
MAQSRKPTPKTQQQLSNEYNGANSLLGNPNLADPNDLMVLIVLMIVLLGRHN